MSTTIGLEQDVKELNNAISQLRSESGEKKAAADQLVADLRASGKNPLLDKELFERVDAAYKEGDLLADQAAELEDRRDRVAGRLGEKRPAASRRAAGRVEGAVDRIFAMPEYQRLLEGGAFNSGATAAGINVPGIEIASRAEVLAALNGGSGGLGRLFAATADVDAMLDDDQRRYPPVPVPVRQIRVLDMITRATTDTDNIIYTAEITRTDAAAETALGTAYSEATYEYEPREAPVRDIGHFTKAHRSNLADRGQVRALLEGRLGNGVERRLETQVVQGNGTGQNLTGILNTSDINSVTRDTTNEKRLEALHRGITAVRLTLFGEPDAIGLHPTDYEETVFEKGSDGHYLLGPASQQTSRTVWGFPVAVTTAFPQNTGLVGNYKEGAVLWLRSGVMTRMTDSHEDDFTKRLVTILAELRAAFAAWQPVAFCEVNLV